jgi:hypothetical protein
MVSSVIGHHPIKLEGRYPECKQSNGFLAGSLQYRTGLMLPRGEKRLDEELQGVALLGG